MINVAIYIVMGLIGCGLLAMLVSGVRSLIFGKVSMMAMGIMAVPFVILIVLGLAMDSWAEAGIMTIMISVGLTMLGLLVSGVKGIFS
ncbi:MAG: hypothetical protein OXM02_01300 [Bacteroidota bacterium]|nr:hypothetical protein [Bacteroidota bacterium]MDE2833142.1 hypothetical protein [Bacteroidota bacterium]MDE2956371.1 hypothetical protein [Bacteroidota bacterium]